MGGGIDSITAAEWLLLHGDTGTVVPSGLIGSCPHGTAVPGVDRGHDGKSKQTAR